MLRLRRRLLPLSILMVAVMSLGLSPDARGDCTSFSDVAGAQLTMVGSCSAQGPSQRPSGGPQTGKVKVDAPEPWTPERWEAFIDRIPECEGHLRQTAACQLILPEPGERVRAVPAAAVRAMAEEAVAQVSLPEATPRFGPDPSVNKWNMIPVGFPVWLWTDGPTRVSDSTTLAGLTFSLEARLVSTSFDMGDGEVLACATTAPYPVGVKPGTPSPVCGHVYERASLPAGVYVVRATTTWEVTWSALGESGRVMTSTTGSRELRVGELQAVVVSP